MGVRGVIFDFQEWLVRLKCILEAFGTGVPARKVTVNPYWQITETKSENREITHRVSRKQNPEKF